MILKFSKLSHIQNNFNVAFATGCETLRATSKILLLICAMTLVGCSGVGSLNPFGSSKKPEVSAAPKDSAEKIYNDADDLLDNRKFEDAAKKFEEVDRLYPYSPYARRSIVMAAVSYQKAGNHIDAIKAAKNYRRLHPGTKESAIAQNIIASSYYEQISNENHDQSMSRIAYKEYSTLIKRFPNSPYTREAQNRILIITDVLAAAEMKVGHYYRKRGNFLAAINRFKAVVKKYQKTRHVEEALMRLTETYLAIGVVKEAQTAAAVLGHNFPDSSWYRDAYALLQNRGLNPQEDKDSWISRAWTTTVKPAKI